MFASEKTAVAVAITTRPRGLCETPAASQPAGWQRLVGIRLQAAVSEPAGKQIA